MNLTPEEKHTLEDPIVRSLVEKLRSSAAATHRALQDASAQALAFVGKERDEALAALHALKDEIQQKGEE
jgi:hypothetical protein